MVRDTPAVRERDPARSEPGAEPSAPVRVRLSRAKGWRMPPNTKKADRTTKLGNPFVVGVEGSAAECVKLHRYLLAGYLVLSCKATVEAQREHVAYVRANLRKFRGVNLACWCREGQPCHVPTLLEAFNHGPAARKRSAHSSPPSSEGASSRADISSSIQTLSPADRGGQTL